MKVIEIKVRKVKILPGNLIFENVKRFWVYVVPYTSYERRGYLESNVLQLRAVDYNSIKRSLMTMQLVNKCEVLILEKMKDLKNVIYELDDSGLQFVRDLRIYLCPNLECVIDWSTPYCPFVLIKSLSLENLIELREIFIHLIIIMKSRNQLSYSELEKLELKVLPNLISFDNAIDWNEPHQTIHQVSKLFCQFVIIAISTFSDSS